VSLLREETLLKVLRFPDFKFTVQILKEMMTSPHKGQRYFDTSSNQLLHCSISKFANFI